MTKDEIQIKDLIERQFAALSWADSRGGDWLAFAEGFVPGVLLYPAARPVVPKSVQCFTNRMQALSRSSLKQFYERLTSFQVQVYGNVAVAIAVCEMVENEQKVSRNIETLLLVKDNGRWRIAAQAWDRIENELAEQIERLQATNMM